MLGRLLLKRRKNDSKIKIEKLDYYEEGIFYQYRNNQTGERKKRLIRIASFGYYLNRLDSTSGKQLAANLFTREISDLVRLGMEIIFVPRDIGGDDHLVILIDYGPVYSIDDDDQIMFNRQSILNRYNILSEYPSVITINQEHQIVHRPFENIPESAFQHTINIDQDLILFICNMILEQTRKTVQE